MNNLERISGSCKGQGPVQCSDNQSSTIQKASIDDGEGIGRQLLLRTSSYPFVSRSSSTPHPVADLDFVPQLGASRCSDREIKRNGDASSSIQQGMFCGETVPFLVRGMAEH